MIVATRAFDRTAIQPGHIRLRTRFVKKYKLIRRHEPPSKPEVATTLNHIGTLLFRRDQRLFLSVSPSRLSRRQTVHSATSTLSIARNSLAVMPGRLAICSRMS